VDNNFIELIDDSKTLNSKIFTLLRLELLSIIASLGEDGITYRELKASLGVRSDGALYSNLKALEKMEYIKSVPVKIENKELESYKITTEGQIEWERIKTWLRKFVSSDGCAV
jgi:DNA-binding PadR family transcriptional regulator